MRKIREAVTITIIMIMVNSTTKTNPLVRLGKNAGTKCRSSRRKMVIAPRYAKAIAA
jgi:hypothetical protein